MKRVAVTGVGVLSPIGNNVARTDINLRGKKSRVIHEPRLNSIDGLQTKVAGLVTGVDFARLNRKTRRSMGRVARLMALATMDAVDDSGINQDDLSDPMCGVSISSTIGSGEIFEEVFHDYFREKSVYGQKSTSFLKVMSHTCAANIALMYSIKGRVLASSVACASSSQSIGLAFEAIQAGHQKIMIAGGADEMHWLAVSTFDVMQGASYKYNDTPSKTPRPFDKDRDGLVVAEGAGCLILEEMESAKKRGANIYAELESFYTNSDGYHIAHPSENGMARCMTGALQSGRIAPHAISYINAHATATELGDIAEARATRSVFGDTVPVSSTKSYTGHTLGASGAVESVYSMIMMGASYIAPTLNLDNIDPACQGLDHVTDVREAKIDRFMCNNFAFGGVNTSLIYKKV